MKMNSCKALIFLKEKLNRTEFNPPGLVLFPSVVGSTVEIGDMSRYEQGPIFLDLYQPEVIAGYTYGSSSVLRATYTWTKVFIVRSILGSIWPLRQLNWRYRQNKLCYS